MGCGKFPLALWVKAFNSVYFKTLESEAHRNGDHVGIPLASDVPSAMQTAADLVRDAGFDPVIVDGLARGKEFEPDTPPYNTGMSGPALRRLLDRAETTHARRPEHIAPGAMCGAAGRPSLALRLTPTQHPLPVRRRSLPRTAPPDFMMAACSLTSSASGRLKSIVFVSASQTGLTRWAYCTCWNVYRLKSRWIVEIHILRQLHTLWLRSTNLDSKTCLKRSEAVEPRRVPGKWRVRNVGVEGREQMMRSCPAHPPSARWRVRAEKLSGSVIRALAVKAGLDQ